MQNIRVVIPTSFSWLSELATTELNNLSATSEIKYDDNPFRLLAHDEAELCLIPLQHAPYHFPVGIVITALRKREQPEYMLLMRKNLADPDKLLGVPENAAVVVPDEIVENNFLSYFPNVQTEINPSPAKTANIVILPIIEVKLRGWSLSDDLAHELHPDEFIPAAGQGSFAWICREDNTHLRRLLKKIHCSETVKLCNIERRIARRWQEDGTKGNAHCSVHPSGHYQLNLCKLNGSETEKKKYSSTVLSEWESVS